VLLLVTVQWRADAHGGRNALRTPFDAEASSRFTRTPGRRPLLTAKRGPQGP